MRHTQRHSLGRGLVYAMLLMGLVGCAHFDRQTPGWEVLAQPEAGQPGSGLYYEESGQGDPILLIHGFGANLYTWRYIIPALSRHHHVIAVDLKGFGNSPKPSEGNYTAYDQARLVYRLIQEKNLHNLTIIGHSFGGGVALVTSAYLAEHDPERQKNLVLIDSASYLQPMPWFIDILATPVLGPLTAWLLPDEVQTHKVLELAYHNPDVIPVTAVAAYARPLAMPGGKHATIMTARQSVPSDIDALTLKYRNIKVPTLILWGDDDKIVPLISGKRLHEDLPNSAIVVFESCGHIPQEEMPLATQSAIEGFLSRH